MVEEEFDYERYKTDPEYREKIDAGTFDQQFQALMSSILYEKILRSGVSRQNIELKKHETTIDTPDREIYAGCPFCEFDSEFHYNLGTHLRDVHPKKTVKKFSDIIKFFVSTPEKVLDSVTDVNKFETKQCPFCSYYYPTYETRKIRKHVRAIHGDFIAQLYDMMR